MSEPPLPQGLQKRKAGDRWGNNKFMSTIMGTAVFVAEMQRKVPVKTKLLVALLIAVAGGFGAWAYWTMSSADDARAALDAAVLEPPETGAARVRELLREGLDEDAMVIAIDYLGRADDAESVPLLIEALDGPADARRAAAVALASIGPPAALGARDALAAGLEGADPGDVVPLSWALAALGDGRGLDLAVEGLASGQLQEIPSYDPRQLAELLGREGLIARLGHPHATVRQFAASHLGRVCDGSVVGPLTSAARDDDDAVVVSACVSLSLCPTPDAHAAVVEAVRARPQLLPSLGGAFVTEVGAPGLAILLGATEDLATRRQLVQRFAQLHDPRAGDAVMAEWERTPPEESQHRQELTFALAEISDARVITAAQAFLSSDEEWARRGVEALGASGLGDGVETALVDAMRAQPNLRGSILRAMGEAGVCSEDAQRLLRAAANSPATMGSALMALGRCGHADAGPLALRQLQRLGHGGRVSQDDGNLRFAAYDAIARTHHDDAGEYLLETVLDTADDARMRTAAADALGIVGDDATLERAADAALAPDTAVAVRTALFRALRHRTPASARPRMMGYVRGGEDNERTMGAAAALGLNTDAALRAELTGLLDDERARGIAGVVLAQGGDEASGQALASMMRGASDVDQFIRSSVQASPLLLSSAAFESGRLYDRLEHLVALRDRGVGAFWDDLGRALREGADHPGGMSAREIRRALAADLAGADPRRRRLAAEALLLMNARGVLLATAAEGAAGREESRAALSAR